MGKWEIKGIFVNEINTYVILYHVFVRAFIYEYILYICIISYYVFVRVFIY